MIGIAGLGNSTLISQLSILTYDTACDPLYQEPVKNNSQAVAPFDNTVKYAVGISVGVGGFILIVLVISFVVYKKCRKPREVTPLVQPVQQVHVHHRVSQVMQAEEYDDIQK